MNYEELTQYIQVAGYRLTSARKQVVKVLCATNHYLGAYDIHHKLEEQGVHIGIASVYRVLELLNSLKLLQREEFGSGGERFRLINSDHNHAHQLICSKCGQTQEFEDCPLIGLAKNVESTSGFQIQEHWLRFFGLCPHCQKPDHYQH